MMKKYCGILSAVALALVFSACSRQASVYNQSPVCRQAKNTCRHYENSVKQAGTDRGAGLEQLREDCEGSQRACAESAQNLQPSIYPDDKSMRGWRDMYR